MFWLLQCCRTVCFQYLANACMVSSAVVSNLFISPTLTSLSCQNMLRSIFCPLATLSRIRSFNKLAQQLQCRQYQLQLCSLPSSVSFWSRNIATSSIVLSESDNTASSDRIEVNYITKNGEKITLYGKEGDNVMYLAHQNAIDIEGACEASLACCTCHVYVRDDYYDKLTPAVEEEEDMLDMAPFLKPNSRLSCQLILSKDIDGIEVTLPPATRNFYVDDHKPSHH